tara:strand:- start:1039 stop:1233 length:195 start_codon:yes stop_codon:yes gene_type:complete
MLSEGLVLFDKLNSLNNVKGLVDALAIIDGGALLIKRLFYPIEFVKPRDGVSTLVLLFRLETAR